MHHRSRLTRALEKPSSAGWWRSGIGLPGMPEFEEEDMAGIDQLLDEPADRVPILHLTPKWSQCIETDPREDTLCQIRPVFEFAHSCKPELEACIRLTIDGDLVGFRIPVRVGKPELNIDNSMKTFGLVRLGPGTWKVDPSVNMPDAGFHAFLVLCEVPEPAPWDLVVTR